MLGLRRGPRVKAAQDVIITEAMPAEQTAQLPVLLGDPPILLIDPPGGLLDLCRGLDALEFVDANPVLELNEVFPPPGSGPPLVVPHSLKILCLKLKKILLLATGVEKRGVTEEGRIGWATYILCFL